ncbi:MAG: cytochrome c biogenesis protein CcsA [Methanosarcinaceae archaeon]|nr:cytochrome c biogenesis protein CcsA [Methanosarcinaceae archaeon]
MILVWLSFVLGSGAAIYSMRDQFGNDGITKRISKQLELGCAVTTTLAMVLLTYYLCTVSASFHYVYLHSSTDLSLYYRISALWAGQEGSLLLWTWAILIVLLLMQYTGHTRHLSESRLMGLTRTISLLIATVFLMLLVLKNPFTTYQIVTGGTGELTNWNPFAVLYPITDGLGMNPLLRNPWMAIHPPVLFFGYAAFTIPFAAAIADLLIDDERWMQISRNWMRIAWFFLTLGIGLGGFWAYEVLGWGAWYWTWDPVETSSLIPWITATAYLHAQTRSKKGEYRFIAPLLAIASFILVIFATFVTRSGMWVSVHSWQDFTSEGMLIALFLLALIGSSTVLLVRRYFEDG